MEKSTAKIQKLVGLALLSAVVVVLQLLAGTIQIGPFSPSFVLIPIVVGAAIYGAGAGAFLGGVFSVVVVIACITGADKGGNILWTANPALTALMCMLKGIAAGWVAGLVYRAFSKKHKILGAVLAAILCPIVNTGIFVLGMFLLFKDILVSWAGGSNVVYYALFIMVGVNFLIEVLSNMILSPVIVRVVGAITKKH